MLVCSAFSLYLILFYLFYHCQLTDHTWREKRAGLTAWTFERHFKELVTSVEKLQGAQHTQWKCVEWTLVDIVENHLYWHGTLATTILDVPCVQSSRSLCPSDDKFRFNSSPKNIRTFQKGHINGTSTVLSIPFVLPFLSLLSPYTLCPPISSSSLPPHLPLSSLPIVKRCGKRHVLSFPQRCAGCQCRRWTPSRQLSLYWALWLTVQGHSPRTGNLWKRPFWLSSLKVSF